MRTKKQIEDSIKEITKELIEQTEFGGQEQFIFKVIAQKATIQALQWVLEENNEAEKT